MATTRQVAENIKANVRDSGGISSYSVRVSVASKDHRKTFKNLVDAKIWRDMMLVKQAEAARKKPTADPMLKGWGWV